MTWEREFFSLAGSVLDLKLAGLNPGGPLAEGVRCCPSMVLVGELTYSHEMKLVLSEAGMLPAQRLRTLARRLGL
jgi:hypothetical protein